MNHKNERNFLQIRSVLLNDWDPIGINDNSNLAEEYDIYINPIITMLKQNFTVDEIAYFLEESQKIKMGINDVNKKCLSDVATKLKSNWQKTD